MPASSLSPFASLLRLACGLAVAVVASASSALADTPAPLPFLSPLFGEHMMLQRNQPNRLWGWAAAGTEVKVTLADRHAAALAGPDGRWQVQIDPPAAGGPYTLTVDGPEHREFRDVLVGDIWLCGGQSNMEFGLAHARDGAEAVKNSAHPGIRLFRVSSPPAYSPASVVRGEWSLCEPATFERGGGFAGFSAVAYFFGRKVHETTGIPIGLIQDAVGGTPAESWMSPEALKNFPEFSAGLAEIARLRETHAPVYGNFIMHWYDQFDPGVPGQWSEPAFDDHAWTPATLHDVFTRLKVPATPAVVWLRREIDLPTPLPAGRARLLLGVVEKMDTAWINGRFAGASAWVENPRAYPLFDGALHPGRNQITLRVLKLEPDGGFRTPAADLKLVLGDGTALPLEDGWRAALAVDARPPHPLPLGYENWPVMPTVLYHGLLRPLAPLAIAGALWYQGEANFTRAAQYRALLPAMIADWRTLFGRPDLPFYIVSLPAFMKRRDQPGSDGWTEVREAQALAAQSVPHTALAVTIDTGDADNIHPIDKLPVGERLALLALRHTYGRDVVCDGPTFARVEQLDHALRVHFTHTDGGLVVRGARLGEFSVAGADRVWHWADAHLEGDTVLVSSPAVPAPVAVRYAWQANPLATLFNAAGLPAAPFRSDNW